MPPRISLDDIKLQLISCEELASDYFTPDPYYAKWRRHYLLKRLLELQLREFDCEHGSTSQ